MNLAMLVEMAGEGGDDRLAVGRLSYAGLLDRVRRGAAWLALRPGVNVGLVDVNSEAGPIALFGAAAAGRPFAPSTTAGATSSCAAPRPGWPRRC